MGKTARNFQFPRITVQYFNSRNFLYLNFFSKFLLFTVLPVVLKDLFKYLGVDQKKIKK